MVTNVDCSIRKRILEAAFVVVARSGRKKLQVLELAAEAGVSLPTVYRCFGSREGVLDAFVLAAQGQFDAGVAAAAAGLDGADRLDAAMQFIVDHQFSHGLAILVDAEPDYARRQMALLLPSMRASIGRVVADHAAEFAAASVARIALCHYLVGVSDRDGFLAELRHAVGLNPRVPGPVGPSSNDQQCEDLWVPHFAPSSDPWR